MKNNSPDFSQRFETVFVKDVFQENFKIESILNVSQGVYQIKAKRIIPLQNQNNKFDSVCAENYLNKLCNSFKKMNLSKYLIHLKETK